MPTILKRDVITNVTAITMRLLEESYLNGTKLWPKNGVVIPAGINMQKGDIIEVRPVVDNITDDNATGTLLFNMYNKSYARVKKQMFELNRIMDCSATDDCLFNFETDGAVGMGIDRTFGQMKFNFTYTPSN